MSTVLLAPQSLARSTGSAIATGRLPGRAVLLATAILAAIAWFCAAGAATLDGVAMPDTMRIQGRDLRLNGLTVRSYSILRVRIYVAGLYVEAPTHDAASLLRPSGTRALVFRFLRDVDVQQVRGAWQEGFDDNCPAPCAVPAATLARFLDSVIAVKAGDESVMVFDGSRMAASLNGRPVGSFDDAGLSRLLLACFFGPKPPSERLKEELLGLR